MANGVIIRSDGKVVLNVSEFSAGKRTIYMQNVLTVNLVALYELNETSGTVVYDATGNSNATRRTEVTLNQTGILNKSYYFDSGNYDFLYNTHYSDFDFTNGQLSINMWVRPYDTVIGATRNLIKFPITIGEANGIIELYVLQNGSDISVGAQVYDATNNHGISWGSGTAYDDFIDQWTMLTFVYDHPNAYLYVNGSLVNTGTNNYVSSMTTSGTFYIGTYDVSTFNFYGWIDQTGIWNRPITQNEITYLYNSGNGLEYNNW